MGVHYSSYDIGYINIHGEECPIMEVNYQVNDYSVDMGMVNAYVNRPQCEVQLRINIPSGKTLSLDGSTIGDEHEKEEIKMLRNFLDYKGITSEEFNKFKYTFLKLEKF